MINFKDYSKLIRETVKSYNTAKGNEDWKWHVKGINKNSIKIGWDYLSNKESFTIGQSEDIPGDLCTVILDEHGDTLTFGDIVDDSKYGKTPEEAIESGIKKLIGAAEYLY